VTAEFVERAGLAIVIPVHNGLADTVHCLDELRRLEGPPRMVVIVDDGSSDGTADHLEQHFPDVHVLPGSGDLWWSGAVDAGCRFAIGAGARYLMLLNNDNLELAPNLIVELVRLLDTYGGLAGAIVVEDKPNGERQIVGAGGRLNWHGRGIELRDGIPRYPVVYLPRAEDAECDWLPGAALAFHRDVFQTVGGFDTRAFPQYRGDVDFTTRARAAGYRCTVTYAAWVVNDTKQTWINFGRRLSYRDFLLGFVSLRSSYNVREAIRFAWRHCPRRLLPRYLTQYYLRYAYGFWKSRHRLPHEAPSGPPETAV
jgi:GT2 family glycosyltransferase